VWAPKSLPRGFRRVHTGTQHLGWTRWRLAHAGWGSENRAEHREKLVHARRDTGTDVEDARVRSGKRREYGLDDVCDVHEVTLVATVTEQGDGLATFPAAEEDGDHAALEISALAWTVDVRKPKGDRPKVGQFDELFRRGLEPPVVRLRIDQDVLVGTVRRFAVDRTSGGDITAT